MKFTFAFALSHDRVFSPTHFGEAPIFAIFVQNDNHLDYVKDIINPYYDENSQHGNQEKGHGIINLLMSEGVNILVSRQFGKNIKIINKQFIPIIIATEQVGEVIDVLQRHIHWIEEEWNKSSADYKLFKIKSSVLKLKIDE